MGRRAWVTSMFKTTTESDEENEMSTIGNANRHSIKYRNRTFDEPELSAADRAAVEVKILKFKKGGCLGVSLRDGNLPEAVPVESAAGGGVYSNQEGNLWGGAPNLPVTQGPGGLYDNGCQRALTKGRSNNFAINSIIVEIEKLQCDARWVRIPTAHNIADCLTRLRSAQQGEQLRRRF
jgi:hypothetical protein